MILGTIHHHHQQQQGSVMTSRAQATGAPIPVTIGDLVLRLSPLTDRMEAELDNWVGAQIINKARHAVAQEPDLAGGRELIREAISQAATARWDNPQGAPLINTLEGWAQVFWQATRHNTPGVSAAEITRALKDDPAGLQAAVMMWLELNHRGRAEPVEDPKKNAQRRDRRRRHRKRNKNRTWGRSIEPWPNGTAGGRASSRN
jgi:hypothetical protein